jgi:hypothetical protein
MTLVMVLYCRNFGLKYQIKSPFPVAGGHTEEESSPSDQLPRQGINPPASTFKKNMLAVLRIREIFVRTGIRCFFAF